MTEPLCHTKIQDIPWFMSVSEKAETYLSSIELQELSDWYQKLLGDQNE